MSVDTERNVEAEVTVAEEQLGHAISEADWVAAKECVGEDFTYVHSNGNQQDQDEWISGMRAVGPRTIVWEGMSVRPLGSVALVSGRNTFDHKMDDGSVFAVRLSVLRVWAEREGTWKLVAHHGTLDQTSS